MDSVASCKMNIFLSCKYLPSLSDGNLTGLLCSKLGMSNPLDGHDDMPVLLKVFRYNLGSMI